MRRSALVALFCVSVLWFFFLPHDVPASAQKLRESLPSSVPAKREKEVEMKPMVKAKDPAPERDARGGCDFVIGSRCLASMAWRSAEPGPPRQPASGRYANRGPRASPERVTNRRRAVSVLAP